METEGDASNVVFLEGNAADEDKLCTQKPLFRLMKFVRETQCEMEVVKPVLDELEVMRLCREFGMMSSVNPKDFDFDILHARDFDDDFVRFLRYELLENSSSESVKFKGLFGKQDQIQAALTEMNVCSTRTTKSLDVNDEGIYCVKFDPECASEDKLSGLVVFSWIRDELFEPQSLRDIPTFVLRFLTGLVPDIVCCTSGSDLEQLKAAMLASESYEDEFPSYSVSFEVKKQVDQEDDVKCAAVDSIDLGEPTQGYSDVSLLKGSYPALASKGTMSPQVRRETQNPRFNSHAKFAVWLKDQSHQYRITLSGTIARSRKLCEALLRQFALWPEELLKSCREEQDKTRREEFDLGTRELVAEVERQRKQARELSSVLFELQADAVQEPPPNPSIEASSKAYGEFLDWINSKHTKKVDHKIKLQLDAPTNLREIQATLLELYTNGLKGEANKLLDMCATLTKPELVKNVKKFRERSHGKKIDSSDDKPGAATDKCQSRSWEAFLMEVAEPLNSLRKRWWIAVEHVLAEAKDMQLKLLKKKADKSNLDDSERQIIDDAFKVLCESLLSKEGLMLTLNATTRNRGAVFCDSVHEVMAPPTTFLDISKVEMNDNKPKKMEPMGRLLFNPTESHVAMYTVKVRSAIQIVAGKERMCAKLLHFPHVNGGRRPLPTNEKVIRTFGKFADICDYNVRDRVMAFVSKEMVGIYKLDEAFKHMELIKSIDLGVRSTLTALPFQDIMLIDSTVYVTDSTGYTQSIGIHNDQTSNVVRICSSNEGHGYTSSGKMSLADNLVVGAVNVHANDSGAFEGALECISRDDYRGLPILPLGMTFLVDQPQCVCIDDQIFVLDPLARKMYVFAIQVTVRSDSYRMQQCDDSEGSKTSESESGITNCLRKQHWMYTFYHVFEKFPVQGLLESGPARHVKVNVICSSNSDANAVLENCHDFLSLLMSDLLALNKPLNGLNLTEGLAVARTLDGISLQTKSLISLLQTLITFLPIQICRAEGNALTVLRDGMDDTLNEMDLDMQTWEAIDIAESIRFGLLSPLLSAWRGRCVVITSMGKQSTGKSYFLNHLTGSSFAIAGNRCTDGAWMTLRMMKDILFVVLDFEGLGSFERTDQEDVFLSVLNASLSMFTIFRMEMRFDKVVDGMFSNFQKGTNLLKSDEHLFQGSLYMSVKDVNTNDNHAVLSEFKKKLELLMANREQNFLTTMYSGKVAINSSPPLGTNGYYASLRHTRQLITKMIQDDPLSGFATGNSFHDCVRLVLAKISILDWTSVDETSQRLQMNDIYRKLPGALRTGCLIPVDAQTKSGTVQQYLMEPLLQNENDLATLRLDQLSRDYSEFLESWMTVNKMVLLDEWEDDSIDFGPLCFDEDSLNTEAVHLTLVNLFQRFLALISKGPLDKLTEEDYANFDAVLSFLICRRETKVALWVKQLLGAERFMKEWEQIEDYFCTFKAMLSRCEQGCAKCMLQCMRSFCHSINEAHDCGMDHKCRSLCEYCIQNYSSGKQTPPCVIKAGHEGKCNCGIGVHTCGAMCSLESASNCERFCVLMGGHDGEHRCSVKQHACGAACSAAKCSGHCVLNAEHKHNVHKCAETQCNHACEMQGCKERCGTSDHFHGQLGLWVMFAKENDVPTNDNRHRGGAAASSGGVTHLCNASHACSGVCEVKGVCNKIVQVSVRQFFGACDSFNYEDKRMVPIRNQCAVVLEPGQVDHEGVAHSCTKLLPDGSRSIHSCDVKCAACEYLCDKEFGHKKDHSAAHGNMRNMHFASEDGVFQWGDHKYAVGDKGIAEMCNMYCSSAGRGHAHYMKCNKEIAATCLYTGFEDQRRHCKSKLKSSLDYEIDEVLHKKYWETIGWEDPCQSAAERALFAKCPYMCNAPEHKGKDKSPSCCDLQAWHPPATPPPVLEQNVSYIDGHRFHCSHANATGMHHVFVLDCSGSMRGNPWRMLLKGVREYLQTRLSSGSTQDVVSMVTFGDKGKTEYERVRIQSAPSRYVHFGGGGTYYANGLKEANAIISRSKSMLYKPVLIFFTDGRPADRKKGLKLATDIKHRYALFGLQTFVVGMDE